MDENILKYRQKHKKCEFCKYHKHITKGLLCGANDYHKCILKNKLIYNVNFIRFCKYYSVKEEK